MRVIRVSGALCFYDDNALPEMYQESAIWAEGFPENPADGQSYHMDIVDGQLVWVLDPPVEPTQEERIAALEEENKILKERIDNIEVSGGDDVWNEMDTAYQEGVNSAYDQ